MYLGRVVGCVWASAKDPHLLGQRLLLIQPVRPDLSPTGKIAVCLDSTGAGAGETVYYVRGKEASFPFLPAEPPADATVVGIVDTIHTATPPPSAAPSQTANPASPAKPRKGRRC
jgi:ethanolamine utilization protein EutN